jgi:hypothetical protein
VGRGGGKKKHLMPGVSLIDGRGRLVQKMGGVGFGAKFFAVFVVYPGDIVGYVGIYGFGILCTQLVCGYYSL